MLLGNVHIFWLLGIKHITVSDKKERARIAVFLLQLNSTLGLKLFVLLNLHLTMHLSLTVFETAKLLSNNKPFFSKTIQQDLSVVDKKRHLVMLSQRCYKLYPADNIMLSQTLVRIKLSSILLVPPGFFLSRC